MSSPVRDIAYRPSPALNPVQPKEEHPVLVAIAILSCILVFFAAVAGITWWDGRFVPMSIESHTVHAGETEWSIAEKYDPMTDPRKVIAWWTQHGVSTNLQPGEVIPVPIDRR